MKTHDVEQGSLDWSMLHIGRVTASELDNLVDTKFEKRAGEMPKTYLAKKIAEKWRNAPLVGVGSWHMDQGHFREDEARALFAFDYDLDVEEIGFCESDDGRCGCSPDGLIGDDAGLEIKSPEPHTHVKYLLNGGVPKEYLAQVHMSMFVTGRPRWFFLSYCNRFPNLVIEVKRDPEIQAKIKAALDEFYRKFDAAMKQLEGIA